MTLSEELQWRGYVKHAELAFASLDLVGDEDSNKLNACLRVR